MGEALHGLRVLEFCGGVAGAFCSKILADFGAEVIKLEAAEGDPERHSGPFPPGRRSLETSGRFLYLNTNKMSRVVDAASTRGRLEIVELVAQADVVIDDWLAGILTDVIGEPARQLVWCSITPYGLTGPYAHYLAYHLNVFHAGGEASVLPSGDGWTRFPDRPPIQISSEVGYFDTGMSAAVAVLGAVHGARATGAGERIDVSVQESQIALNRTRICRYTHDGLTTRRSANVYASAGGKFACGDGSVQILGMGDKPWQALAALPDGERFDDERVASAQGRVDSMDEVNELLASWCRERTKAEAVATLGPLGFAVGAYALPADLIESPQIAHRGFFQSVEHPVAGRVTLPGVPYRMSATPVRLGPAPLLGAGGDFGAIRSAGKDPDTAPRAPLADVRVLDFSWAAAGPWGTELLAFLGAEVIKVESAERLDAARRGFSGRAYPSIDEAPDYATLNLSKRSLRVDLGQDAGRELVRRLIPLCDVMVDNFRPGVMTRLGLGPEDATRLNPDLIVAASSGNGATGPEAQFAGLASIFMSSAGVSEQTGYPDGPPTLVGESPDFRSGNALAVAIIAALVHRQRTGEAQYIDLSSREAIIAVAPDALLAHVLGDQPAGRLGNHHPTMSPHAVYPSVGSDEWVSIAVGSDEEWRCLCDLIERPDLAAEHPDAPARKAAEESIDAVIAQWTSRRSARDAFEALQRAGVASAPTFTNADLVRDGHLAERGVFVSVDHPLTGPRLFPGPPWHFAHHEPKLAHAPLMGQDADYVLDELLGVSAEERPAFEVAMS